MGTDHHGNPPLPLETPNQHQLQPLNDDEIQYVLAVYHKIETKVTDNEKADPQTVGRHFHCAL
jgi:hypothetical protein